MYSFSAFVSHYANILLILSQGSFVYISRYGCGFSQSFSLRKFNINPAYHWNILICWHSSTDNPHMYMRCVLCNYEVHLICLIQYCMILWGMKDMCVIEKWCIWRNSIYRMSWNCRFSDNKNTDRHIKKNCFCMYSVHCSTYDLNALSGIIICNWRLNLLCSHNWHFEFSTYVVYIGLFACGNWINAIGTFFGVVLKPNLELSTIFQISLNFYSIQLEFAKNIFQACIFDEGHLNWHIPIYDRQFWTSVKISFEICQINSIAFDISCLGFYFVLIPSSYP